MQRPGERGAKREFLEHAVQASVKQSLACAACCEEVSPFDSAPASRASRSCGPNRFLPPILRARQAKKCEFPAPCGRLPPGVAPAGAAFESPAAPGGASPEVKTSISTVPASRMEWELNSRLPLSRLMTKKNTGVRKMPTRVTPNMPLKTAVPRVRRISAPRRERSSTESRRG